MMQNMSYTSSSTGHDILRTYQDSNNDIMQNVTPNMYGRLQHKRALQDLGCLESARFY